MSENAMPPENAIPTVEAIASFFQAYLEILELQHGIPLKTLSSPQAEELNSLLGAMLHARDGEPLYIPDKSGLRQLQIWFQQGVLP